MKKTSVYVFTLGLLGLLAALPAAAQVVDSGTLNFQTSGQSMWGSGSAFNFSASPTLFDLNLNGSTTAGIGSTGGCPFCLGASLTASTSGDFGLGANVNVNGGTVDATVPVDVTIGFPGSLVAPSTPINLTSSALFGTGSLTTASPSIQASANTFGSIGASLSGTACAVACTSGTIVSVGPLNLGTTLFSIDSKTTPPQTISLFPGVDLNVGLPFVATSGTGGPAPFPPPLSISASGGPSNFLGVNANLTNLLTSALGLPPLSGSGSLGPLNASYNILTVSAGLNLGATQAFNLSATPLVAYKVVEVGAGGTNFTTSAMPVGTPFNFSLLGGVSAFITPEYFLSADLMNNTGLALSASAGLSALGASLGVSGLGSFSIGPVINLSQNFPITSLSVYDNTFGLGGWNMFEGKTFEITATPEPGTLLLLGSGALALARGLRRRSAKA